MKSVLLIGMGKFGQTLGEKLLDMGDEVMIVDKNEDVINALASHYTNALITNCMNVNNLKALDVPSFDVCIVAIADDFQSSLEVTSLLRDCGAKYVIARATTEIQRKFLLRNGADEVNVENGCDFVELEEKNSIFEIAVPASWVGKSLLEVSPRKKYGINVLTIKKGSSVMTVLDAEYVFEKSDKMVVFGETEKIINLSNKTNK